MTSRISSFIIFIQLIFGISSESYLSYKGPCRRSNPILEQCLIKAFENFSNEMATGDWFSDFQGRPLDPLNIQNHVYPLFGIEAIAKMTTKNLTVFGLSNYKVLGYKVNLRDLTADIKMLFPKISDTATFSFAYNIFDLKSDGSLSAFYKNLRASIHLELQKFVRNGTEYLGIVDVVLESDKTFGGLRPSHPIYHILTPIGYPGLERSFGEIIKHELNKILEKVSLDQLLPK